MRVIAITGAFGFIGRQLLHLLSDMNDIRIRVLVHQTYSDVLINRSNIIPVKGDLMKPETLEEFLEPGCSVVNLAYLPHPRNDNLAAMDNLISACKRIHIKRFVHCSTATVVGATPDDEIVETTSCKPKNEYEVCKLQIENLLLQKAKNEFELAILRPTAVFGLGGRNLMKMADELLNGSKILNYLKLCLYNYRRLNLVAVENVVGAILFLLDSGKDVGQQIYIVSDDDKVGNTYFDVAKTLLAKWNMDNAYPPVLPIPLTVLSIILKLAGRSDTNPKRIYSGQKLVNAGFYPKNQLDNALESFAAGCREPQADV